MYKKDFATSLVATAPSPATSGTSLVVTAALGTRFPPVPFWAVLHPDGALPTLDNAEKVLVTARSTDTLTITRAQGGTTAQTVTTAFRISNAVFTADVNTYDAVVGPYDDYTTLGAALTAASNGWTILVKPGSYTEVAITCALLNITIIADGATLAFATTSFTTTGNNWRMIGGKYTFSTGSMNITTNSNLIMTQVVVNASSSGTIIVSGTGAKISASEFTSTNTANQNHMTFGGNNAVFSGNYVSDWASRTAIGSTEFSGQYQSITGNSFTNSGAVAKFIYVSGGNQSFTNNAIQDAYGCSQLICLGGGSITCSGNAIKTITGYAIYSNGGLCSITGNMIQTGSTNCIAVGLAAGNETCTGNRIYCANATNSIGVEVSVGGDTVSGNSFSTCLTGIKITTGSGTIVEGNALASCATPINDAGTATTIMNNGLSGVLFDKRFHYMRNTSGATINAGNIVTFKAVTTGDEVTTTVTASDPLVYGMAAANIANNAQGYIQVSGKTAILTANGTTAIAIGDFLTTHTVAGIVKKAITGDIAIAISMEAYAVADSNGVLDALLITPRKL